MSKRVLGKVIYHDFSGGFWGIVSDKGIEYRPLNFPIQLKIEGVLVDIVVEDMNDEISMFMWGQPIKIISFSIL